MVKLTGPLMSVAASQSFGGTIVYAKWKGQSYARLLVTPYNPKSAYQQGIRDTMQWGVLYFTKGSYVTASQRTWWNTYGDAESPRVTGENRFIRQFIAMNYDSGTGTFIFAGIPTPN